MGCLNSKDEVSNSVEWISVEQVPKRSMVHIYRQDPTVKGLGFQRCLVNMAIYPGPSTEDIVVYPDIVKPSDTENNYLYSEGMYQSDAVHTLVTVNLVLHMYRRCLRQMHFPHTLQWYWGKGPLRVYPWAGELDNAFYSRENKSLSFFYYRSKQDSNLIFTSRSFDVVTHETGHAILDALKPRYLNSKHAQTQALHESFADLTTIFLMLDEIDICETILKQCNGDLHTKSALSTLAEELGESLGRNYGIRNADADIALDEATNESHQLSLVFTGAIYDMIVDYYEMLQADKINKPAEDLFKAGKHFSAIVLAGIINAPYKYAEFVDVMEAMLEVEPIEEVKPIIRKHFEVRKIYRGSTATPRISSRSLCIGSCGTMQLKEHPHLQDVVGKICKEYNANENTNGTATTVL